MFPVIFSEAVGLNDTFIVVLCPAASVSGVVTPLSVKSFALTVIPEIVRLTFPLFVMVTVFEPDVPVLMLPNAKLVGLAVRPAVPATPVPVNVTVSSEFAALLAMLTLPVKLPAVVGAKEAVNEALAPAAMLVGVVRPLTLKPLPLTAICDTSRGPVPELVIVKVSDFVCPSVKLPKLKIEGETEIPACVAVPLNAIASEALDAFDAIVIVPESFPAAVGVNVAVSVTLDDGFTVNGAVMPLTA
jgi:hypothetical protein